MHHSQSLQAANPLNATVSTVGETVVPSFGCLRKEAVSKEAALQEARTEALALNRAARRSAEAEARRAQRAQSRSEGSASGTSLKSVVGSARNAGLADRFKLKAAASRLVESQDETMGKRLACCGRTAHFRTEEIALIGTRQADGSLRARFSGVMFCGSPWACPVCSDRIARVRRDELNELVKWARGEGHFVLMLTHTMRHRKGGKLSAQLADIKEAQRRFRQSEGWRKLCSVGSVTATEMPHGENGWHCHQHCLVILPDTFGSLANAAKALENFAGAWDKALKAVGRTGGKSAFHVSACEKGDYLAKLDVGAELALGQRKTGKRGSRTPFQILEDARDGDAQSCSLFREYAAATKGRRMLVWSKKKDPETGQWVSLKTACGLNDVSDEDAAEQGDEAAAEAAAAPVVLARWSASSLASVEVLRRHVQIIRAAEAGESISAVLAGLTDAERWAAERRADFLHGWAVGHAVEVVE